MLYLSDSRQKFQVQQNLEKCTYRKKLKSLNSQILAVKITKKSMFNEELCRVFIEFKTLLSKLMLVYNFFYILN